MKPLMIAATALLLAACTNLQSPTPKDTPEEAEARRVCETHNHSDIRLMAVIDPIAACMDSYLKYGWGRHK